MVLSAIISLNIEYTSPAYQKNCGGNVDGEQSPQIIEANPRPIFFSMSWTASSARRFSGLPKTFENKRMSSPVFAGCHGRPAHPPKIPLRDTPDNFRPQHGRAPPLRAPNGGIC